MKWSAGHSAESKGVDFLGTLTRIRAYKNIDVTAVPKLGASAACPGTLAVRESANKSAASAASPDYVKFQAVIKSAASAAPQKSKSRKPRPRGVPWLAADLITA